MIVKAVINKMTGVAQGQHRIFFSNKKSKMADCQPFCFKFARYLGGFAW